ncbi:hypothetical protein VaNZ11_011952 [Volvox africanus]|uniref:EGF-like domain-containing protein n=1 Tax=Volvox africanus TaxID=51714 RepID=A0ABQ5SE09_9CHLO|nr:hypothetical protein VaNZ11_011952 [Volvox africanus]
MRENRSYSWYVILALTLTALVRPSGGIIAQFTVQTDKNPVHRKTLNIPLRLSDQRSLLSSEDLEDQQLKALDAVHTSAFASHPDVGLEHIFAPLERACHPDCTKRGNCNAEDGRCECPFGYTGPTCDEPLLPACQQGPGLEPFFGLLASRNCECLRQANRFFGCSPTNETCTLVSMSFHEVQCFSFTGKVPSEQWSQMPAMDEEGVEYYKGWINRRVDLRRVEPREGVVGGDIWGRPYLILPLEKCGHHKCHGRGACAVELPSAELDSIFTASNGTKHFCMCYKGYKGHTCNEDMWELCPNRCRGRGQCIRGFCHCRAPYWGLDCGRERAWQLAPGASLVPNRLVLRIYVYELPANVAFPVPLDDNVFDMDEPSYLTHRKFLEMLLLDTAIRTENPLEANLFFVPATAYSYSSNTNSPVNQIEAALKYVIVNFPYFNASGGADHFVWTTGDRGACYLPRNLSRVIFLTLFGLHANLRDNATTFLHPRPEHHPNWGCVHPKKDVVVAPWYDNMVGSEEAPRVYENLVAAEGESPERYLLFFFAGSVRMHDMSYSNGVRQALFNHLKALFASNGNYSDILFVEGYTASYGELYMRSRFCLAPHGGGFGVRLTLAMAHACIPVIIQDQVYQPYESDGILPYSQFALRLSKSDIPNIVPILRAVSVEKQKRMRLAMAKYYHAFLWDASLGGRAYNYTIKALNQRLHGLWGRLWGDPHRRQLRVA